MITIMIVMLILILILIKIMRSWRRRNQAGGEGEDDDTCWKCDYTRIWPPVYEDDDDRWGVRHARSVIRQVRLDFGPEGVLQSVQG